MLLGEQMSWIFRYQQRRNMKFLIDMNLSPDWVRIMEENGFEVIHWSQIGEPNATDKKIFNYARDNNFIVFTHDLDFGDILAATGAKSPSVIQIRTQDTSPNALNKLFLKAIKRFENHLNKGVLITIDPYRSRARILPIKR